MADGRSRHSVPISPPSRHKGGFHACSRNRWDPFAQLSDLRSRFDQPVIEDMTDGQQTAWSPAVDVVRQRQARHQGRYSRDLADEVKIEVEGDVLRVSGSMRRARRTSTTTTCAASVASARSIARFRCPRASMRARSRPGRTRYPAIVVRCPPRPTSSRSRIAIHSVGADPEAARPSPPGSPLEGGVMTAPPSTASKRRTRRRRVAGRTSRRWGRTTSRTPTGQCVAFCTPCATGFRLRSLLSWPRSCRRCCGACCMRGGARSGCPRRPRCRHVPGPSAIAGLLRGNSVARQMAVRQRADQVTG